MNNNLTHELGPELSQGEPWIGVDFDGTLATYDGWKGPTFVGEPVIPMMARVVNWLALGKKVKIFTARADRQDQVDLVKAWLEKYGLPDLEVTNVKDRFMIELWDDRVIQVVKNTGRRVTLYNLGLSGEEKIYAG